MELVANVWPVVDEGTGLVQRYLVRAYAMRAEDRVISAVLKALAPTDFRIARAFKIPTRFKVTSEYGTLSGAVPIGTFHQDMQTILEEAYRSLENDYAKLQCIDMSSESPRPVNVIPRFPNNPYTVTTVLIETPDGRLIAQLDR
jgi:hypothetical protein